MERIVCEPALETGEGVQLQRAAVDDRELPLDVTLEVIDGHAQGLGRLLLVEGETGHLTPEALASSVTVESTRAHQTKLAKMPSFIGTRARMRRSRPVR
jgi:hypothetical protein